MPSSHVSLYTPVLISVQLNAARNILRLTGGRGVNRTGGSGFSPLTAACRYGHLEMAALLLDSGADIGMETRRQVVDVVYCIFIHQHRIRIVVLHACTRSEAKASPFVCRGVTPLMAAAFDGHAKLVDMLIQRGAKVDYRSKLRLNACDWAIRAGHRYAPLDVALLILVKSCQSNFVSLHSTVSYAEPSRRTSASSLSSRASSLS